jgi:hypothetical protein
VILFLLFFWPLLLILWPITLAFLVIYVVKRLQTKKPNDIIPSTQSDYLPILENDRAKNNTNYNKKGTCSNNTSEILVSNSLQGLDPNAYALINNILVPSTGNIALTQIDHVLVSRFGVFCIETKARSGYIFGSKNDRNWTQCIYGKKKSFFNPVRQNYCHTSSLERLLSRSLKKPIIPISVLPNAQMLNIKGDCAVFGIDGMLEYISSYKRVIYSIEDMNKIFHKIHELNITNENMRTMHISQVNVLLNCA